MSPEPLQLCYRKVRNLSIALEYNGVTQQEMEYLSVLEESEGARYNSRGVFGALGHGVEVEEYDSFTLYDWRCEESFGELLELLEPMYPLSVDPALEMVKEEGRVRDADRDHDTLSNELVYDPVRAWRGEDRWSDYSMIQVNLTGAKVVWDEKGDDPRIRIYEIEDGTDVFEKMYPATIEEDETWEIVSEVKEVF